MIGATDLIDRRFELLEQLGSGGMGTVWRARDIALHREVALKQVRYMDPAIAAAKPDAARVQHERVLREARALARLSNPNVVTIHHIVDTKPYPWLVMELVEGASLQDRLAHGPLTPHEAARIGRDVLVALRAAHAAGIHHRDVKPSNILLRRRDPLQRSGSAEGPSAVLTDFGIATIQGETGLTPTGDMLGSPEYIAPECLNGGENTPASDLWSLGMTLYTAVEGVSPMRRGTTLATLVAVLKEPVPPPVNAGLLAPALTELLVPDPRARPDAERLDALLSIALETTGTTPEVTNVRQAARAVAARRPASSARRRWPLIAAAAVATTAVAAAGGYTAWKPAAQRADGIPGDTLVRQTATVPTRAVRPAAVSKSPEKSQSPTPGFSSQAPDRLGAAPSAVPAETTRTATVTVAPSEAAVAPRDPVDPEAFANGWISKLDVIALSSGATVRDEHLASVREQVPEAEVLFSDQFASMGDGYWVIFVPQRFATGVEAVDYCRARGRTTAMECAGRYLSHISDDFDYRCHPTAEGGTTGRCTHP